jgi:hypothetical protein
MKTEEKFRAPREMVRRFALNIRDKEAGRWLATRQAEASEFLAKDLDTLPPEIRLKVYAFIEGFFPEHFSDILAVRLRNERDAKCLELLHAISNIPRKSQGSTEASHIP